MINLLSTERKSDIRAARSNVILLRYTTIVFVAVIFILGVLYVSYTILEQTKASADARIASNTESSSFTAAQQEVTAVTSKLSQAKAVLDQEKSYATVLTSLGKLMPAGTYLETLKLDSALLSGGAPTELVVRATTDEAAGLIQQQWQSSPLFSQVTVVSTSTDDENTDYPVVVTYSVVFNGAKI